MDDDGLCRRPYRYLRHEPELSKPLAIILTMDYDPLDDLPIDSRTEVVADVCAILGVDLAAAEDVIRSAEPFWDGMERAGGLVDSWGGGEFCGILPRVLAYIKAGSPAL